MRQLKIFGAVLAATLSIVGCGQLPSQSPHTGVQSYDYSYSSDDDYSSSYVTPHVTQTNVIGSAIQLSGHDSSLDQRNSASGGPSTTQTNVIGSATQLSGHDSILVQKNSARRPYYNTY